MVFVPFTDVTSIVMALMIVLILDILGLVTHIGSFYVAGGVLSMFTGGLVFHNGYVITAVVYDINTSSFVNQTSDANLYAVILAIVAIMSFALIFYEKSR